MKVTLAKAHLINGVQHKAGAVLDLPITAETAAAWQQRGLITGPRLSQSPSTGPRLSQSQQPAEPKPAPPKSK